MTIIQHKRTTTTATTPTLAAAEMAISTISGVSKIYMGSADTGSAIELAKLSDISGVVGAMIFKGVIDASTEPNYPAGTQGDVYVFSVAGKIGGASGIAVEIGDMIVCNKTNTGGSQASVGADWNALQTNISGAVTSSSTTSSLNNLAMFDSTNGQIIKDAGVTVSIDGTLGADSDSYIPTQKAVKSYVDANAGPTYTAGSGISISANAISVLADTTSTGTVAPAITIGTSGVGVKVDNSTVSANASNQLSVKDGGISTEKLADNAVALAKLAYDVIGNGLAVGAGVFVLEDTTSTGNIAHAINVTANGVGIRVDNSTITTDASNQLTVSLVDGGTY